MEKRSNIMPTISRIFFLILLVNSLLISGVNLLQKSTVKKGELNLFFSKKFDKNSVKHFILSAPHREIYDFQNTRLAHSRVPLGLAPSVRMAQYKKNTVRVVIDAPKGYRPVAYQPLLSDNEYHISLPKGKALSKSKAPVVTKKKKHNRVYVGHTHEPIVIDAGHGGHDTGAMAGGKREKDLVLQIAKRVERALKKLGYPVYMTRRGDRFLKLTQRTHIADRKKAVAFISIHANSVPRSKRNKVHGIETFFLQNTRDAKSQRIAARENKAVLRGTTKLSRNVIIDSVLTGPKIVESNKLAIDVQRHMMHRLRSRYRGVKDSGVRHAPFWVLVGASRPSILVEVGYISHPRERKRLFTPAYQELLAKGIADGVDSYLHNRKKEVDIQ